MVPSSPAWPGWSRRKYQKERWHLLPRLNVYLARNLLFSSSAYLNKSDKHWGQVAGVPGGHSHSLCLAWWVFSEPRGHWKMVGPPLDFYRFPQEGRLQGQRRLAFLCRGTPAGWSLRTHWVGLLWEGALKRLLCGFWKPP